MGAGPNQFLKLRGDTQTARIQDNVSATLRPVATALSQTPIMGAAPPAWVRPDLLADFVAIAGQALPAYQKDALGYVHGKGAVSTAAGQAAGTVVYVLPIGFRPSEVQRLPVRGSGATYQSLTVSPNGNVAIEVNIGAAGTTDLAFTFLAES